MADEDFDSLAGEYVLGTLDAEERRAFLRRLGRDPGAVSAVVAWQERLAPLALALEPVEPPATLFPRIEAALDGARPMAANDNRAGWWRAAAIAATMVAVVGLGFAFEQRRPLVPEPASTPIAAATASARFTAVAALSEKGQTPVLFVAYDRATGRIEIVPSAVDADAAHSLQLWLIQGKAAPRPVGLVDPARAARLRAPDHVLPNATFAVSREPVGGSPTGLPTGPVLWSGSIVAI